MKTASLLLGILFLVSTAHADSSTAYPPSTEPSQAVPAVRMIGNNGPPRGAVAAIATPIPSATPLLTPAALLTDVEKKKLASEFQKALSNQRGALAHQEKSSMKELAASQSMKQKKWREEQKKARQQYFDTHTNGPDRREYVQNYVKQKADFDNSIKAELAAAKKTWADKNAALKESQKAQEGKFNQSLLQGVRPGPELWPANN